MAVTVKVRPLGDRESIHGEPAFNADHPMDVPALGVVVLGGPFQVDVDDDDLEFLVQMTVDVEEGRLACVELLATRRPDGPPITSAAMQHVRVTRYLTLGLTAHPYVLATTYDTAGKPVGGQWATGPERAAAVDRSRRHRTTAESVTEVVAAYRQALANPAARDHATQAVADALFLSRGHVSRLLTAARRQGLLSPSDIGRGGKPTHIEVVPIPKRGRSKK